MSPQTESQSSTLLTAALEKLLYLESRLESAEAGREEAVRERDRQRIAAQAARQAVGEWQKRATDAEVAAEGAEREVSLLRDTQMQGRQTSFPAPDPELEARLQQAQEQLTRYERERETWLDRMVVLGRLQHEGDDLDLGSFIAELRAELLALRRGEADRRGATVRDRPAALDPTKLLADAPAGDVALDPKSLVANAKLSRPERTLAAICARDLRSDAPSVRRRAAERLAEAKIAAINPLAVTLLPKEPDAHVRVALIKLLEATGGETANIAVGRALTDVDPRVRAAALEALARRAGVGFDAALSDADPAVRRRALALLPRTADTVEQLSAALRDSESSVRRVAALALSGCSGREADALLQVASESSDAEVREIARKALGRRGDARPVTVAARSEPGELDADVADEVRTSLRGRTVEELAKRLDAGVDEVRSSVTRLIAGGALVWRGRKLYPV